MKFPCPHCGNALEVADEHHEVEVACGHCGGKAPVPVGQASDHFSGLNAGALFAHCLKSMPPSGGGDWEPPSPEELARLLPQYRIEGIIGRGGMGVVYKAHQGTLERAVAIKLLPAGLTEDPNFVARFEREARTLAHLEHPGIIHVHDFGQTSAGHLYFVMEFVDGTDLYQLIQGPGLTSAQALDLVSQICDALQYAHGKGVVHRDIKPANILITREGRAKLADFGLARPVQSGESGQLTRSRVVMGTPEYMAPEQKRGEGDHRVDLYALGVMLYEMLCGRTPQGAWQVPSQQVPVDVRLDQVVIKAMQEEPARRYQQASEVKTDVDLIRTSTGETPKPGKPAQPQAPGSPVSSVRDSAAPSSKKALLIGAACVVPLIGAAVWFASRQGPPAQAGAGSANASLAAAAIGHPWTNTLGLEFLPIPGAAPTLLATTETRGSDWDAFLLATQHPWKRFRDPTVSDKIKPADHPISGVSWHDANAFCEWLTEKERKEGRLPADMRYRLPTDHEWSQAAGISEDPAVTPADLSGKDPAYAWGMAWPPPKDRFNVGDVSELPGNLSWQKAEQAIRDTPPLLVDDHEETCAVKCYPPDEHGFYGLTGNVSEWVWDKWKPSHNEHGFRVLRGAGWFSLAKGGMPWLTRFLVPGLEIAAIEGVRSAKQTLLLSDRERAQPTEAWPYYGFRIALAKSAETLPDGILPLENGVRVNSLGMHLLPVDGSAKPESYVARWETRVRDYQVFATETSRIWGKPAFPQGPDHPAVLVSMQDCEAFCQWLTLRERQSGAIPQDWSYRLPTNQEWLGIFLPEPPTLMAKADQLKFWSNALFNENISDHSRYAALGRKGYSYRYHDGHAWTAPVGSYKPMVRRNVSFYDVGGNVAERQICPKLTRGATPEISTIWGEDYAQTLAFEWSDPYRTVSQRPLWASPEIGFRVMLGKADFDKDALLTKEDVLKTREKFQGHTYAWVISSGGWTEFDAFARGIGGHLVTITSAEENAWLLKHRGNWYIGGRRPLQGADPRAKSSFSWVTGEPMTFDGWTGGQPSNGLGDPKKTSPEEPFMALFTKTLGPLKAGWLDCTESRDHIDGFIVEWDTEDTLSAPAGPK